MSKVITIICIAILCGIVLAIPNNPEMLEQTGIETNSNLIENPGKPDSPRLSIGRFNRVLMSPVQGESLGLFDPYNGDFLGCLCYIGTGTPINAVQGPDNNIYVSYQTADAVNMYDTSGTFLGVYASSANGLDNVRGVDFRDGHLFITNGSSGTKTIEMSGPNTVHRIFIQDGSDPFDIFFLPNGKSLLADIAGSSDNVRIYDTNGVYLRNIFSISFPEQIQEDLAHDDRFLVAGFSTNNIQNFDTTGMIYRTWPLSSARGVYRLGNGNILGTNGTAVYEIDSATGTQTIKRSGQGRFIELYEIATGTSETDINKYLFTNSIKIHPNPFQGRTTINYVLNNPDKVNIKIYNCLGNEVRNLTDHYQTAGNYSIIWDGRDNKGNKVHNGIYICNIRNADEIHRSKLMLIK
jgi:hypothetical protein